MMPFRTTAPLLLILLAVIGFQPATAQSSALTYQGQLRDGGAPVTGNVNLEFRLFDQLIAGNEVASPQTRLNWPVEDGLFQVELDFGAGAFDGSDRFLEVEVNGAPLNPRQRVTATPYALLAAQAADGAVGGSAIDPTQVQLRVDGTCAPGSSIRAVNQTGTVTCEADDAGTPGWSLTGNAGTGPANFLGTTDAAALELRTNNARSLRIEPSAILFGSIPITTNTIAGSSVNDVTAGVRGATISGGGAPSDSDPNYFTESPNGVTDDYGTVGGGFGNIAGVIATVGGGQGNTASGGSSTVGGGFWNTASGPVSTVGGGLDNCSGGGWSWAGGRGAKVRPETNSGAVAGVGCGGVPLSGDDDGDEGTFIWADSEQADFVSTGPDQFLIRAANGLGLNTANPTPAHVTIGKNDGSNNRIALGFFGDVTRWRIDGSDSGFGAAFEIQSNADQVLFRAEDAGAGSRVGISRDPVNNALEVEGNASKTTAGTWLANSDSRIKTDVQEINGALDRLMQVRPVTFRYTDDYRKAHPHVGRARYYNVIAQEFARVFPEAVQGSGEILPGRAAGPDTEILQVDVHPALITAIAAVQELAVRLERAEVRNAALQARLARLEARLGVSDSEKAP